MSEAASNVKDSGRLTSQTNGRKKLAIAVDVGDVHVRFVDLNSDFRVSWRKGSSCARIDVSERARGLDIKHTDSDDHCGGSRIDIEVRRSLSVELSGGAGSITVDGIGQILPRVHTLSAQVQAGNIVSNIPEVQISRSWSQSSAVLTTNNRNGIVVDFSLGAGNINLRR